MSMVLSLTALSDADMARIIEEPILVWRAIAPEDPEIYLAARGASSPAQDARSLSSRLLGRAAPAPLGPSESVPPAICTYGLQIELDKSWHGIHYLLTGSDWGGEPPLNFLVAGGTDAGEVDVGYGPARLFSSTEVLEICAGLDSIDDSQLRSRFDPSDMMAKQIYPEIWDRPVEEDDTLGYCMEFVASMRAFLRDLKAQKLGMLIALS